eukprot:6736714-Lingulodinium_polyedra.AAC.1
MGGASSSAEEGHEHLRRKAQEQRQPLLLEGLSCSLRQKPPVPRGRRQEPRAPIPRHEEDPEVQTGEA